MKKSNRKGFTIVELVIVIAVIAILAAVLIPTFTNLIKRANLSNDQSFVKNMNTILLAEGTIDPFKTAGDAIDALNRNGFAGKYEPYTTGYHYCYSLENNKMYLLDDKNEVVYPKDDVDEATLWGLYTDNKNSVVSGVTKYVAMTNVKNSGHFNEVFAEGTFTIDLNGHFIAVDTAITGVQATNGAIIKGATAGENAELDYELVEVLPEGVNARPLGIVDETAKTVTIKNKIFTEWLHFHTSGYNYVFENCIFFEAGMNINDAGGSAEKVTVKNCQFSDIEGWSILSHASIEVIDCTFTNLFTRGAIQIQENSEDMTVKISGCSFDGTAGEYPVIRFVGKHKAESTAKLVSFELSNCNFVALNKATGVLGFSGTGSALYNYTGAEGQPTVTFANNTFAEAIGGKYLVGGAEGNTLGSLLGASR